MITSMSCRIDDTNSPDIMITVQGEVETTLQQARFFPEKDTIVTDDNSTIDCYFKNNLGIKYFSPIDKTYFPFAPSGWCSWYYYGRDITPEEMLINARWFAENLSEYGLELILLDDGWQGGGRDWDGLRETFPQGMKWLADEIKKLGLTPGIWLCPQGQEKRTLTDQEKCFLLNPDGTSVCGFFGGSYTVDGTKPETMDYLSRLISRITSDWGYQYLKLDGQPSLVTAYRENQNTFSNPEISAEDAFRLTLQGIRKGAGEETFLCGCSGMPTEAVGLYNGQRTGADVDPEWNKGFMNAVEATMHGMFLHNIGWYSDPDCCMLRPPLTLDMAKAWGSLMALTGQMLLFSDRMPDLAPERIEVIKKISPPSPEIRPFDLFPSSDYKQVIDCKINHCGRNYDVVGVFNYNDSEVRIEHLNWEKLGLDPQKKYHVYDFWSSDYLGQYQQGIFLEIAPASCRVITLYEVSECPVLLSTNRHVLQGWPDLEKYFENGLGITGSSKVIAGEKYTLTFAVPMDEDRCFVADNFKLNSDEEPKIDQGRGVVRISWIPIVSKTVDWHIKFSESEILHPGRKETWAFMTGVKDINPWTVEINWVSFGSPTGFCIWQDGELLGYSFGDKIQISNFEYLSKHQFEVAVADLNGMPYEIKTPIDVKVGETLEPDTYLSDLNWKAASSGYWMVKKDKNVSGGGLASGGHRFRKGLGTHPRSIIEYRFPGAVFKKLIGKFGIEDQNGINDETDNHQSGRAIFSIHGNGRELLAPQLAVKGEPAQTFEVDLSGIEKLELIVDDPDDLEIKNLAPHADWLDMTLNI